MRDAELTPTGRELKEPSATLVECTDPKNLKHTVIAYDAAFVGHPALTKSVDLIMSFMAYPMVTGLVECNAADTARGRFAYPTGTIWTIKEVLRGFDQVGQTLGARAALEMCYLGGMILMESGETGAVQGCFSHGNLSPWRVGLKADGQLQVFGYGLAQVEMIDFIAGKQPHLDPESIRYAPPERLEGQPEQPSSDTYSLAVIAYELITGKPLFPESDGPKLWDAVKMAEGATRLAKDAAVPKSIREILATALIYDPDTRLQGDQLVDAMGNLLDDSRIEGRTLSEVMQRMQQVGGRSARKLVKASATAAFTAQALAALAAEEEDDDVELDEAEGSGGEDSPRWSSVERTTGRGRRRRTDPKAGRPGSPPPAEEPRRLRRREPEPPPKVAEEPADEPRRRRRRPAEPTEELEIDPPSEEVTKRAPPPETARRRPAAPPPPEDDEEPTSGPASDDDDELTLPPPEKEELTLPPPEPAEPADADASEGADDEDDSPRRRRRRRLPEILETAAPREPAPTAPAADDEPPRRRRRRLDGNEPGAATTVDPEENSAVGGTGGTAATPDDDGPEDPAAPLRRRRRRLE